MTGIERLREWLGCDDTYCPSEYVESCNDKTCDECRAHFMASIADQIERETLPRPRFEDGEVVKVGDMACDRNGVSHTVKDICVRDDGDWWIVCPDVWIYCYASERVKRPEPPDSWERLEDDVATGDACRYFGVDDKDQRECRECEGCKAYGLDVNCGEAMAADVLRRAKALAGVE